MTVAEVIRLGRLPHKDNSDDGIIAALKSVGMLHKAQAPLTHLSGGERQRVMIARAFIQDASHILLDEPTNHLDIHYQLEVFKLIKDYRANATVVLHDLNMALEYCDWIHLLEEGRLVESGSPGDVLVPEILEPIYNVRVVRAEHHLHFERFENEKTSAKNSPRSWPYRSSWQAAAAQKLRTPRSRCKTADAPSLWMPLQSASFCKGPLQYQLCNAWACLTGL
ncbi:hypothetical protein N579_02655 [Corynebacterium pseudodiphtheriticum 090104]|nr:hypothetical protein N579_02655 [Corynebacterium pseudodiphtheriticum 090104]